MKSKYIKIGFLLTFVLVEFFGFGVFSKTYAAKCTVTVAWGDQNQNVVSAPPASVVTPQTYSALVTFQNCIGYSPSVNLKGPNYGNIAGTDVNLGSPITQTTETRWATVNLTQAGGYWFSGSAQNTGQEGDSGNSPTINATAPSSSAGNKIYACKAGNGAYACSPSNSKDLHDVTSNDGDCAYSNTALQVDPSWCGCTDVQINAGTTGTKCQQSAATPPPASGAIPCTTLGTAQGSCPNANQTCTGGVCVTTSTTCTGGPGQQGSCNSGQVCSAATGGTCSIAVGGQTSNSYATLINPITGYDNLTALLVNIMKGFLGIIAVWAVVFIVIGGFKMVVSSGNEEAVLSARKTITWAVLGLLVAVLSFAIVAIVQNLIGVSVPANPQGNITTGAQGNITTGPQGTIP